jgi:hypothetical protein
VAQVGTAGAAAAAMGVAHRAFTAEAPVALASPVAIMAAECTGVEWATVADTAEAVMETEVTVAATK